MRTAPLPCQVRGQDSWKLAGHGRFELGWKVLGFKRSPDPGFSPFRVREGTTARGLALGGSGDGTRIQTLPWGTGV